MPSVQFGKMTIIVCENVRENMILVGLGSNLTTARLKSSQAVLEAALNALEKKNITVVRRSLWYRSAPVPPSDQPWFVNGVAQVETSLPPHALLEALHAELVPQWRHPVSGLTAEALLARLPGGQAVEQLEEGPAEEGAADR